ncbi:MAG: protein of unknown function containing DUF4169 domain [Rhodobacteraceae bacterium HLUCCA12]|nr:MAG: protein of unknown function containing DUF4169 domain [Rhodobacteraceae bacterium HLUCCA12]
MAEIVNLRQKRKQAARAAARKSADENAARFGQTKAERTLRKAQDDQSQRRLDGHRRDSAPDDQA